MRRDFDRDGGDGRWFERFQAVEAANPIGQFRMSDLSAAILRHGLDYGEICEKRRANYQVLRAALAGIALFENLPDDVAPLGFPVRTGRREALRMRLFDQRIYPPVHWPLEGIVPREFEASHCLSAEILTLPCDQRYGPEEMERTIAAVREVLQ
jgi:dTDP-4-amino-4,6-dideoxygalactose transaminase